MHRQGSVNEEGPLKRHSSIAQFISSSCLDTSKANFIVLQTVIISNKKLQNISCLVCVSSLWSVCVQKMQSFRSRKCAYGARGGKFGRAASGGAEAPPMPRHLISPLTVSQSSLDLRQNRPFVPNLQV